jgi:Papain-like cysteine protease AvrRpt2
MPAPEGAQLSPDGYYYWDGTDWQPVDGDSGSSSSSSSDAGSTSSSSSDDGSGYTSDGAVAPVNIVYQVAGMSQPADHACWATSFAVVINYRDGSNLTPADVSNAVGVDINSVESWEDVTNAANHFNLQQSASACMNVQGWAQQLSYGPLWICINGGSHAIVVNGVQGDGTPEGTAFYVTDPWDGPSTMGLNGLEEMFEKVGAQQPGDGLIIWHP